jgi:hypothetical protein
VFPLDGNRQMSVHHQHSPKQYNIFTNSELQ